jgi:hypothetical protein
MQYNPWFRGSENLLTTWRYVCARLGEEAAVVVPLLNGGLFRSLLILEGPEAATQSRF